MNQLIEFEDIKISVRTEGQGEPIIFAHGWPTNMLLWQSQFEAFKESHRVILMDWVGFGHSSSITEAPYTFTAMKKQLDRVISRLIQTHEKLTIVAHDIGGPPAILWAEEHPERINQMILLNTVLFPFRTSLDQLGHLAFTTPMLNTIMTTDFGMSTFMKFMVKCGDGNTNHRIRQIIEHNEIHSRKNLLRVIIEPVKYGRKNEIAQLEKSLSDAPYRLHLIIAQKDPLCGAHMRRYVKRHPEVSVFYLPRCGHYIPIDQAEQLNEILKILIYKT